VWIAVLTSRLRLGDTRLLATDLRSQDLLRGFGMAHLSTGKNGVARGSAS